MSDDPGPEYLEVLASRFGHSSFRPMQWRIIRSIIVDRRDNCVIMATGYGKSLTYQYPSVFLDRLTFVVSPLISLMEDQVLSLNVCNIPACLLGSAQTSNRIPGIEAGEYRVVYVTPEFITGEGGKSLLRSTRSQLALIAVDEAHCLSKWGHDFRPAYRNLSLLRTICPDVPILAVTATATPKVRDDIVQSLQLTNAQVLCSGFDRPNLKFIVRPKGPQGPLGDIRPLLANNREGSIIIYCLTRKQTEEIVALLSSKNITCEAYHAGLSIAKRRDVLERFVRDRLQIIVATIAFGMGIDKPDVRLVIHYGASKDLESYYQEAGRAGRDGQPSQCIMFWSRSDFTTHEFLRSQSGGTVQHNLEQLSKKMGEYLDTRDCRRRFILQYFEDSFENKDKVLSAPVDGQRHNCCDNCTRGGVAKDCERFEGIDSDGRYDFATDAELLLKAFEKFGGGTGSALPILLLRGSKSKKLHESNYNHPLYGKGKAHDEEWWKSLVTLLERAGFLDKTQVTNHFNRFAKICTTKISPAGRKWLDGGGETNATRKLLLKPTGEMFKSLKMVNPPAEPPSDTFCEVVAPRSGSQSSTMPRPTQSSATVQQELFQTLMKKRSELANAFECMPYMIASNTALQQMAAKKPLNLSEMKNAQLDGFSDAKLQKFGREFLVCIQQKLNFLPQQVDREQCSLTATQLVTWNMWHLDRKSVAQIATDRNLAESTIVGHLCQAVQADCPFEKEDILRLGVDEELYAMIALILPDDLAQPYSLSALKEICPPDVTYSQLKLVLAFEKYKPQIMAQPKEQTSTVDQELQHTATNSAQECNDPFDDGDDMFDFGELDRLEAAMVGDKNVSPSSALLSTSEKRSPSPIPATKSTDSAEKENVGSVETLQVANKTIKRDTSEKGPVGQKIEPQAQTGSRKRIMYFDNDDESDEENNNDDMGHHFPKRRL
ncbi:bifunctional 3'-5' exonuclease/ATP-dependent helicase WRN-like [Anopheles bellator]|uniref:bifunctional 3'-5' exonuclease/ATP-dependent helicase WRN-like n=1 Tax=Anopheles bellator TaxID=139047 RepID=UPI0026492EF1|nr:bifunctional 3'-5' exonuclease/ATP-dependent helicase WRN-like [Anopheles bellator]